MRVLSHVTGFIMCVGTILMFDINRQKDPCVGNRTPLPLYRSNFATAFLGTKYFDLEANLIRIINGSNLSTDQKDMFKNFFKNHLDLSYQRKFLDSIEDLLNKAYLTRSCYEKGNELYRIFCDFLPADPNPFPQPIP